MAKTILAVDDSATVRQMVGFTLKEAGYDVLEAHNGRDALRWLAQPLALVITDLNMPELDGIGLIKQVRANAQSKFVPVIVLTTESGTDKKQEARAAGATGWIVKPFRPDQLVNVVRKVIG